MISFIKSKYTGCISRHLHCQFQPLNLEFFLLDHFFVCLHKHSSHLRGTVKVCDIWFNFIFLKSWFSRTVLSSNLFIASAMEKEDASTTDAVGEGEGAVEGNILLIGGEGTQDKTGEYVVT